MDSPLNLAHQQGRKADGMLKSGKYDEAINCHNRAAEYLLEAMQMTCYKPALESLRLQHAHHLKQTNQLYDRQRRAQILQIKQSKLQLCNQATQTNIQGPFPLGNWDGIPMHARQDASRSSSDPSLDTACLVDEDSNYRTLTENDSLIGFLIRRRQNLEEHNHNSFHSGVPVERVDYSKVTRSRDSVKSDRSYEVEELQVNNEDLRRHIQQLLKELEELRKDNTELKERLESSHTLFSDVGGGGIEMIPDLPPLEMPQFDFDVFEAKRKGLEEEVGKEFGSPSLDSCL